MRNEQAERMYTLCDKIAVEQNQEKFLELVKELNDLLEERKPAMVK